MTNIKFRPWLVQRLNHPRPSWKNQEIDIKDNPFSFGGGLKNGGLSSDIMNSLRSICSFDYMGASEYEWGALPTTLNNIYQNRKEFVTGSVSPYGKPVYYLIRKKFERDMKKFLTFAADNEPSIAGHSSEYRSRDRIGLDTALSMEEDDKLFSPVGWIIEDDNECSQSVGMFFSNKNMYDSMCKLLELGS